MFRIPVFILAAVIASCSIVSPADADVDKQPQCRPAPHCQPKPTSTPAPIPTPTPAPTVVPTPTPAPTSSPYALAEECSGSSMGPAWSSLYVVGDPGDRLDTDMLGNLSQVTVSGGICTIAAERKATPSGRPFASATPATFGTFAQLYGTWEARFRYDVAQGTWPSWFLLPEGQKGPFPEIDAVEAYGDSECLGPNLFEHVIWPSPAGSTYTIVSRPDGWHTYRFVWTATRVDFFVDGQATWSVTDPANVPQVRMYPIFTWGVGAPAAACRADATTPDRLTMDIDYIRVSAP